MKLKNVRKASVLFMGFLMPFFVVSCYNRLGDETAESDIPLQFTSKILPASTRMTGEKFEENDKIGVFLLRNNESIGSAFICNEAFVSNSAGLFHAEGELFYPQKAKELQVL
ncbi:MAG: fimbrillin family protein, partial [Bacteroides sp.]